MAGKPQLEAVLGRERARLSFAAQYVRGGACPCGRGGAQGIFRVVHQLHEGASHRGQP